MNRKLIYPMAVVVFAAACGGDGGARGAKQQQAYETVQEGSAAGVTSTLSGPGQTLPPITNTNADTTSAFTLNPNVAPAGQAPATMAGAVPMSAPYGGAPAYNGGSSGNAPMTSSSSAPAPRATQSRETYARTQPVERSNDAYSSQPPAQAQPQPQPTTYENSANAGPAPTTDTATASHPSTAAESKPTQTQQQQQQQPQQPPAEQQEQDDNSEQSDEPPPPPPPVG